MLWLRLEKYWNTRVRVYYNPISSLIISIAIFIAFVSLLTIESA